MSCRPLGAIAVLIALAGVACSASLESSLENKSCTSDRKCLPGYACSRDRICVRRERTTSLPQVDDSNDGGDVALGPGSDNGRDASGPPSCEDDRRTCADRCVDVTTDPVHCGECGNVCDQPIHGRAICLDGSCSVACETEYTLCDRKCVRMSRDPSHCGACNNSCPMPAGGVGVCDGICRIQCNPGLMECGGVCIAQQVDPLNCGACGRACLPDEQCSAGQCVRMCPPQTSECLRSCVDFQTDAANCGQCGVTCPSSANQLGVCTAGQCGVDCAPGNQRCGDSCVDVQTDAVNCGACGQGCPQPPRSTPFCAAGSCQLACESGYVPCSGECVGEGWVDVVRSAGLGELEACDAYAAAQARLCVAPGHLCDRGCVNTTNDRNNCGYCDRACGPLETCVLGSCTGG